MTARSPRPTYAETEAQLGETLQELAASQGIVPTISDTMRRFMEKTGRPLSNGALYHHTRALGPAAGINELAAAHGVHRAVIVGHKVYSPTYGETAPQEVTRVEPSSNLSENEDRGANSVEKMSLSELVNLAGSIAVELAHRGELMDTIARQVSTPNTTNG